MFEAASPAWKLSIASGLFPQLQVHLDYNWNNIKSENQRATGATQTPSALPHPHETKNPSTTRNTSFYSRKNATTPRLNFSTESCLAETLLLLLPVHTRSRVLLLLPGDTEYDDQFGNLTTLNVPTSIPCWELLLLFAAAGYYLLRVYACCCKFHYVLVVVVVYVCWVGAVSARVNTVKFNKGRFWGRCRPCTGRDTAWTEEYGEIYGRLRRVRDGWYAMCVGG